jgi:hypothetical protein
VALDDLVAKSVRIPGAVVGRGPKHPTEPNSSIEERVQSLFAAFPALRRDACYVEFMEKYAGALIITEGRGVIDLVGLSGVSTDYVEKDVPIEADGLIIFAMCAYDTYEYDFAFEVSGERRPGVYRYVTSGPASAPSPTWHAENFCDWLEELVDKEGMYEPPPTD